MFFGSLGVAGVGGKCGAFCGSTTKSHSLTVTAIPKDPVFFFAPATPRKRSLHEVPPSVVGDCMILILTLLLMQI